MRIMSLDISKRNIGIAISDQDGKFVCFHTSITQTNKQESIKLIGDMVNQYAVCLTVVGLPIPLYGQYNQNLFYVKNYAHCLRDIIKPYIFIDEKFTTSQAEQIKKQNNTKTSLDAIAAAVILQRALDHKEQLENILANKRFDEVLSI